MKRLALALALCALPRAASAAGAVYTGSLVVPTGSTITMVGATAGCVVTNSAGVQVAGICPSGTAAFSAGTNITITGTNPYTINCPLCFQTTGGTVTGATTFNAGVTSTALDISTGGALNFLSTAGQLGVPGSGTVVGTVPCTALGVANSGVAWVDCFDTSGNIGTGGQVTATQFNIASRREWKSDIEYAGIDALSVLDEHHFDLAWHYLPKYGDPNIRHVGPMANDLPTYLSGPRHDAVNVYALAVTDAIAIKQLSAQIEALWVVVATLFGGLVAVGLVTLQLAREKHA